MFVTLLFLLQLTLIFPVLHSVNLSMTNLKMIIGDFILKQEEKIILFIEEIVLKNGKISFVCKKFTSMQYLN
ncbi:hypothetical protein Avbf_16375 [Armadillidium vulgare]|nr:hypothetical protein Avbf_16375 [Armadillidium vulgare]